MEIVFFGIESKPQEISVDGQVSSDWRFDSAAKTITLSLGDTAAADIIIAR